MSEMMDQETLSSRNRRKTSFRVSGLSIDPYLLPSACEEAERRAESSSLIEQGREENDEERLLSEEEISDLVQNALSRARRATQSLSPINRSMGIREPSSPLYSSFFPSYVGEMLATKPESTQSTHSYLSTKPESSRSARSLVDDDSYFTTRQSTGGDGTFDVEEAASFFGATPMLSAHADIENRNASPFPKWKPPSLPSPSDIVSSSEAIIRRVEEEIENAKKAAREASMRMTEVNSYALVSTTRADEFATDMATSFDSDSFIIDAESVQPSLSGAQFEDHSGAQFEDHCEIIRTSSPAEVESSVPQNGYDRGFSSHGNAFMNVLQKATDQGGVIDLTDYSEDSADRAVDEILESKADSEQAEESKGAEYESSETVVEPGETTHQGAPVIASTPSSTDGANHLVVESPGLVFAESNRCLRISAPDESDQFEAIESTSPTKGEDKKENEMSEPMQTPAAVETEKKDTEMSATAKSTTVQPTHGSGVARATSRAKSRIARLRQLKKSMGLLDDNRETKIREKPEEQKVEVALEQGPQPAMDVENVPQAEADDSQSVVLQTPNMLDSKPSSGVGAPGTKTTEPFPTEKPRGLGKLMAFLNNARESLEVGNSRSIDHAGRVSEHFASDAADISALSRSQPDDANKDEEARSKADSLAAATTSMASKDIFDAIAFEAIEEENVDSSGEELQEDSDESVAISSEQSPPEQVIAADSEENLVSVKIQNSSHRENYEDHFEVLRVFSRSDSPIVGSEPAHIHSKIINEQDLLDNVSSLFDIASKWSTAETEILETDPTLAPDEKLEISGAISDAEPKQMSPRSSIHVEEEVADETNDRATNASETTRMINNRGQSEKPEAISDHTIDKTSSEAAKADGTDNLEEHNVNEDDDARSSSKKGSKEHPVLAFFNAAREARDREFRDLEETSALALKNVPLKSSKPPVSSLGMEQHPMLSFFNEASEKRTKEFRAMQNASLFTPEDDSDDETATRADSTAEANSPNPMLTFFNNVVEAHTTMKKPNLVSTQKGDGSEDKMKTPDASKAAATASLLAFFGDQAKSNNTEKPAMTTIQKVDDTDLKTRVHDDSTATTSHIPCEKAVAVIMEKEDGEENKMAATDDSKAAVPGTYPFLAFFSDSVQGQNTEQPRSETLQKVPSETTSPSSNSPNKFNPDTFLGFFNDAIDSTKKKGTPKTTEVVIKKETASSYANSTSFFGGFFQGLGTVMVDQEQSEKRNEAEATSSSTVPAKVEYSNYEVEQSGTHETKNDALVDLSLSEILSDRSFVEEAPLSDKMQDGSAHIDILVSLLDDELSANHQLHENQHKNSEGIEAQELNLNRDKTSQARVVISKKSMDAEPEIDGIRSNLSLRKDKTAEEEESGALLRKSESTPLSEKGKVHSLKQAFSNETQLRLHKLQQSKVESKKRKEGPMIILNPLGGLHRTKPAPIEPPEAKVKSDEIVKGQPIQFKNKFDVPPPRVNFRSAEDIMNDNKVAAPKCNLCLLEPKEELQTLLDAIMGSSIPRRFNACGALKMFSMNKKNQQTLARMDGFLDALIVAVSTDLSGEEEDYEAAYGTRTRALEILLKVCIPKDNRVIIFFHPDLISSIVRCAMEDDGEIRVVACSAMAMLAKTHYLREPMTQVEGLIDVLSIALLGLEEEEEVNGGEGSIVDSSDDDDFGQSYSQTSDEGASSVEENFDGLPQGPSGEMSHTSNEFSVSGSEVSNLSSDESVDSADSNDEIIFEKKFREEREELAMKASTNACAALLHLSKQCAAAVSSEPVPSFIFILTTKSHKSPALLLFHYSMRCV